MARISKKQKLINMVNSDPALKEEFQQGWEYDNIEKYLNDHSHIEDIVERLAGDLGILNRLK